MFQKQNKTFLSKGISSSWAVPKDTEEVSSQSVNGVSAAPDSPAAFFLGGGQR